MSRQEADRSFALIPARSGGLRLFPWRELSLRL